jgi:hypothetical protein
MKFFCWFILYSTLLIGQIKAQIPNIQWQKCLGGTDTEIAYSVQQTNDSGYIIAGYTNSSDGNVVGNHGSVADYWIVKLDLNGNLQWQKCLGGGDFDYAYAIHQTTDNGYIVAGSSFSTNGDVTGNHGLSDYWLVKLDNSSNIQWQKSLGGSDNDAAYSIQQTSDGGFVLAGRSKSTNGDVIGNHGNYDYWVVKVDNFGNILWQKSLGGSANEEAKAIQETTDGGYIIAGFSESTDGDVIGNHGASDYWIVKLDNNGNIIWQKCFGGNLSEKANSIQQTSDGGFVVAGRSSSSNGDLTENNGNADYWIVKIDNTGNLQWQRSIGGSGFEEASSIEQTSEGGYILAGRSNSLGGDVSGNHGIYDYWVVKLNGTGNIEWQKSLGGSYSDEAYSIEQTADGGCILAGLSPSNDGDVIGNNINGDYWIVKLDKITSIKNNNLNNSLNIYPVPTNNYLIIENGKLSIESLSIHNLLGEIVLQKNIDSSHETSLERIDLTHLLNGVYFIYIKSANSLQVQKILKK